MTNPVVMPLAVLAQYRKALCQLLEPVYTRSIRTMVIRFPSTSYSTR